MKNIGDRIIELRKQKAWSQAELANKVGVSKAQMSRYEGKNVQPPADTIMKIANLLGTTVDFLINGSTDNKAMSALKDANALAQYKELETLPEKEKNTILHVLNALILEYKTRTNYIKSA
jgi:transcriptional regulator with XRE-family HTH domain